MTTISAVPSRLYAFADGTHGDADRLDAVIRAIEDHADFFRGRCDPTLLSTDLGDLAGPIRELRRVIEDLAADVHACGRAFQSSDHIPADMPVIHRSDWIRLPDRPVLVDNAKVDRARHDIRAWLDSGGWGVRQDDLDRVRDVLAGLSGPETDAVLNKMSDDELRAWYAAMRDSWAKGGWPADRIRELEVMLGEKVSLDTWRRVARFSDRARIVWPDPDLVQHHARLRANCRRIGHALHDQRHDAVYGSR